MVRSTSISPVLRSGSEDIFLYTPVDQSSANIHPGRRMKDEKIIKRNVNMPKISIADLSKVCSMTHQQVQHRGNSRSSSDPPSPPSFQGWIFLSERNQKVLLPLTSFFIRNPVWVFTFPHFRHIPSLLHFFASAASDEFIAPPWLLSVWWGGPRWGGRVGCWFLTPSDVWCSVWWSHPKESDLKTSFVWFTSVYLLFSEQQKCVPVRNNRFWHIERKVFLRRSWYRMIHVLCASREVTRYWWN